MNMKEGTIRAALGYPAFRSLIAGLAVSQVGDWMYNLALVTLVYQRTGFALWAGVTTAARVVPLVVLGPVGGMVADRFGRRGVMITCDLVRLVLMLGLALVGAAHLPVLLAPVIAALATAAGTPYLACVSAVTRELGSRGGPARGERGAVGRDGGRPDRRARARRGADAATGSASVAFVVNALTFAVAAVFTLAIGIRRAFQVVRTEAARPVALFSDIADGAAGRCGRTRRPFAWWAPTSCAAWSTGCRRCCFVLVARSAGLGMHGYGYLFAAIGAGGLAWTSLAGRVARLPLRVALTASLAMVGVPMLALPLAHWGAGLALLLVAFTGAGAICVEVMTETGLQRMLDHEVFGRAYGLALPVAIAGIAAWRWAALGLVSALSQTAALLACGGVVVVDRAATWRFRQAEPSSAVPQPVGAPTGPQVKAFVPALASPSSVSHGSRAPAVTRRVPGDRRRVSRPGARGRPCRTPFAHLPWRATAESDHRPANSGAARDRDGRDRMAIFRAYAKVLEADDPAVRIPEAGLRACPGQPGLVLADLLRRTGGRYETKTPLSPHLRDDMREVAELTSDQLLAIADLTEVPVSLEHLRDLDLQTRIVIRCELTYEGDEGTRVSAATRHRPALATVMPDGTVIAGDAFPAPPAPTS